MIINENAGFEAVMLKNKTKYRYEGWEPSGKGEWVFKVDHPRELMGLHAELIDCELRESEKVEYCFYSPRRVSSASLPFGLKAEEASYGICLTDQRIIISKNTRPRYGTPILILLDFRNILYFHIGDALLVGWLAIHHAEHGQPEEMVILFPSTGREHFEKMIRALKKRWRQAETRTSNMQSFSPSSFINRVEEVAHRNDLKKLMSSSEECICASSCSCFWDIVKRRSFSNRKDCETYVTSKATLLLTTKGLLIVRNDRGRAYYDAIDVLNLPLEKIKEFSLAIRNVERAVIYQWAFAFDKMASLSLSFVSNESDMMMLEDCMSSISANSKNN